MKKFLLLVLCTLLAFSSGCWDRKDIESRGYVLGIAIDDYPPLPKGMKVSAGQEAPEEEEKELELTEIHTGKPTYAFTIQFPVIAKSTRMASQVGGGGGEGGRSWEITQVGNSFIEVTRAIASRTNHTPFYEHLQVIVISEAVARKGLANVLDLFIRDPEMRRRTKVFISKEDAKSILDVTPRIEDYSSMYLSLLPVNGHISARIISKTDLGETIEHIHKNEDFVLPVVKATKDEIKEEGVAVIKKDKLVGYLDDMDLEAIKFISNFYFGGIVTAKTSETEEGVSALEVKKSKSKITPIIDGETPRFKVDIKVEGNYAENANCYKYGQIDAEFLENMEGAFARSIENMCLETIKKVQEKYEADLFDFCLTLRTQKPSYWKEVHKSWDEIFPEVEVEVNAEVDIKNIGYIK